MKKINNLDDVLSHIEELRETIKFSDDLFPVVKDLFVFLKDMIPLLMEANLSIKESTSRIPTATDNIENVSQMTETSTNKVLDSIDTISDKLSTVKEMINKKEDTDKQAELVDEISNMANEMVFAFQFQDITTQKLEHTSRILKTVHDKFSVLFKSFDNMRMNSDMGSEIAQALEAEFLKQTVKEEENKKEFTEKTKDIMHSTSVSQDDIDSLFK
jgi:chemotaxis regulatin CheY-phosphate phosphatase CheZ